MKMLDDTQLESFDTEYVDDIRWEIIRKCIDTQFPSGKFNFIDIGGGNGKFTDRILSSYPNSTGTVLDNSQLLLSRNQENNRKTLICESIENLKSSVNQKYDLIFFNWVFHHLVGDSYKESRENIISTLMISKTLLSENGRISIFDNMYNGYVLDSAPSRLIYTATSSKFLARLVKKGGANTAGVGVCFLSRKQWIKSIQNSNLTIERYISDDKWEIPISWNIFLLIDHISCGHFWIKP